MGKGQRRGAAHERATAAALGGVRTGNVGRAAADVRNEWCTIECKERAALPQWLKGAMRQAEGAATLYNAPRLALVVLHELGGRRADDLVVMRLSEFQAWYGEFRGYEDAAA